SSLFFFAMHALCHSSLSYFADLAGKETEYAQALREMIAAGYIDTIHAYGDFDRGGFTRPLAEHVLDECRRWKWQRPVWRNHGSNENCQSLGHQRLTTYQRGDDPAAPEYHLDLLRQMGCRYFWVDDGYVPAPDNTPLLYEETARDGTSL